LGRLRLIRRDFDLGKGQKVVRRVVVIEV